LTLPEEWIYFDEVVRLLDT